MKTVAIESPFGSIDPLIVGRNKLYLLCCIYDCLINYDEAPFASHGLYTQVLNDNNFVERNLGMQAGFEIAERMDARVVYVDLGVSNGMIEGLKRAKAIGQQIVERKLPAEMLEGFDKECKVNGWPGCSTP